jgi:hypothetical protein
LAKYDDDPGTYLFHCDREWDCLDNTYHRVPRARRTHLTWQTAKHNLRAQAVYGRLGAVREEWLESRWRSEGRLTRAPMRA